MFNARQKPHVGILTPLFFLSLSLFFLEIETVGQRKTVAKLPAADRVVGDYIKAIGGRKRIRAVRDAKYDWTMSVEGADSGTAQTTVKAPASLRTAYQFEKGRVETGATFSTAWERGQDGAVRTLTGKEANESRLKALLLALQFVDYKKYNILARVMEFESVGEPSYRLEFSMRNGARVYCSFSAASKLLTKITGGDGAGTVAFFDYRNENGLRVASRQELKAGRAGDVALILNRVAFNSGLSATAFDPPAGPETLDIASMLRELEVNQAKVDERVSEFTFTQKETEREIDDKGEVKKETVKVYEVYPVPDRRSVLKLISENGVPLSKERADKEQNKAAEELSKADRERQKEKEKRERNAHEKVAGKGDKDDDRDVGISTFLRACELVSPRRESLGNREAVVFDFRPRPGFRPSNRVETIVSKLVGIVWIDPIDKEVMRLEARFAEAFKVGGGLVLSLRPGAAFVIEQTRLDEGVWLPKYAQMNLSYKLFLFGGGDVNKTIEWSEYHRFKSDAGEYKLDSPLPDQGSPRRP
jgi:hypothetical protein